MGVQEQDAALRRPGSPFFTPTTFSLFLLSFGMTRDIKDQATSSSFCRSCRPYGMLSLARFRFRALAVVPSFPSRTP